RGRWRQRIIMPPRERMELSARECLTDVVALTRFIQMVRKQGVPSVDFADFGAWLSMAEADSTVTFVAARERSDCASRYQSKMSQIVPGCSRRSHRFVGAFCANVPSDESALDAWDRVAWQMNRLGISLAFGTVLV